MAFIAGSLPFSVWVGRLVLHEDIRRHGDANPGATNVLRAGGRGAAALALALDFLKGALPVGLAYRWAEFEGWSLVLIALAPVAGHAFSPFLGFHGGKAVAVSFGVWTGLTVWQAPSVLGIFLGAGVYLLGANGWAVMLAMFGLLVYLVSAPFASNLFLVRPALATLLAIWTGNMAILIWKHRADLATWPRWRWQLPSS